MSTERAAAAEPSTSGTGGLKATKSGPTVILIVGMAGSGKTSFVHALASHLESTGAGVYTINLDPAVASVPYGGNLDIRDTVNYKEVMSQYNLGPNGAIVTSLNLMATRFDQVIDILEARADKDVADEGKEGAAKPVEYILVDTPGQIEIFTWSASGGIITELLASAFATMVCYVVDTPRCASPATFMSNMLYALSILYKCKLPMLLAFNKTDVTSHKFAEQWMTDFESFHEALDEDSSYQASLSRSMCLVLDEFYSGLRTAGVSAVTGEGLDKFVTEVDGSAEEYWKTYRPELEARIEEKKKRQGAARDKAMDKLKTDLAADKLKAMSVAAEAAEEQ